MKKAVDNGKVYSYLSAAQPKFLDKGRVRCIEVLL
jgi:hypothetical protein